MPEAQLGGRMHLPGTQRRIIVMPKKAPPKKPPTKPADQDKRPAKPKPGKGKKKK